MLPGRERGVGPGEEVCVLGVSAVSPIYPLVFPWGASLLFSLPHQLKLWLPLAVVL